MFKSLDYDNISIVPRVISEIEHRRNINLGSKFCEMDLPIPIISSPMPDVTGANLASNLWNCGGLAALHRFQSIEEEEQEYKTVIAKWGKAICSIPITGDWKERYEKLAESNCDIFLLDTANGANKQISPIIDYIKKDKCQVIAGNVASKEGFIWLVDRGADAVRVGIAGGKACTTRNATGIYYGMASLIKEVAEEKYKWSVSSSIIADGGIKSSADFCKAICLGADVVMLGSMLCACEESPARLLKIDGGKCKIFRGAASYSIKQDMGAGLKNIEGREMLVPYYGKVADLVKDFSDGLRSSMSYLNANNLKEYRKHASFVEC